MLQNYDKITTYLKLKEKRGCYSLTLRIFFIPPHVTRQTVSNIVIFPCKIQDARGNLKVGFYLNLRHPVVCYRITNGYVL